MCQVFAIKHHFDILVYMKQKIDLGHFIFNYMYKYHSSGYKEYFTQ
jgi:hypothetical protein